MQNTIKAAKNGKYARSPWVEIAALAVSAILGYAGLAIVSALQKAQPADAQINLNNTGTALSGANTLNAVTQNSSAINSAANNEMAAGTISLILFVFFLLSAGIAILSVMAGIGGGVIFTPIMLAFTSVNSIVVRGAGLIVAMFSGPVSTGIFTKKGIANYRLNLIMTISQGLGALAGANLAVATAAGAGATGEGLMRFALGLILLLLAAYFLKGGAKLEWPPEGKADGFTRRLRLDGRYYEESEGVVKEYKVKRAPLGIILIFIVGVIGGFFGMGGGWAITPVLNLGMGLPLKLAAANSGIILGIGSCASIWPYIYAGSLIPLFILPWAAGQVAGGFAGSYLLARVKVRVVRLILIGVMIITSFSLLTKGLEILNIIGGVSHLTHVAVFLITAAVILLFIFRDNKKKTSQGSEQRITAIPARKPINTGLPRFARNDGEGTDQIPKSNLIFGNVVYWIIIVCAAAMLILPAIILAAPDANMLHPNIIFGEIFAGASPRQIWSRSAAGDFPGAHFYIGNLNLADGWAMLFMNIGCGVGFFGLAAAVIYQITKEKDWFCAILGAALSAMILLSATGVLNMY